jgi:nucleoside-diphosphate-sugar epimerase
MSIPMANRSGMRPGSLPSMATAFVTGGSGFVGGKLIERLVRDGSTVRALARSDAAEAKVRGAGADPVRGDLSDEGAMTAGARGAEVAFHAAAKLGDWGSWSEFRKVNVDGTRAALRACRAAGVRRFVHVGTEAALLHGQPLVAADERTPLAFHSPAPYPATKAEAEAAVIEAGGEAFETVVVRPRFVWGAGDTTLLPVMAEMARAGRFAWIGGGRQLTATTHVANAVEGLVLAADRGLPGNAYFVTDGSPVVFRDFVTKLLATQGVQAPERSVPLPVARAVAAAGETAWRVLPLPGRPPLARFTVWLSALECTLDDGKAREQLGYQPVITREHGLTELQAAG